MGHHKVINLHMSLLLITYDAYLVSAPATKLQVPLSHSLKAARLSAIQQGIGSYISCARCAMAAGRDQNFITALPTISPVLSRSIYSLIWSNANILRVWRILP